MADTGERETGDVPGTGESEIGEVSGTGESKMVAVEVSGTDESEIVEEPAAGGRQAPPLVADPAAAAASEDDAAPAVLSAAVVGEQPRAVVSAAAAAAAGWFKDRLNMGIIVLIFAILVSIFVYDNGVNPMAWWDKLAGMTGEQWWTAWFLTVGDITSLGLIFSQCANFLRMWTEGATGLGVVVPPLAGLINCGFWFKYGLVLESKNPSVVVVNGTGVVFNIGYTAVFFFRSGIRRSYTLGVILVAAVVAVTIAALDIGLFIKTWGWEAPKAFSLTGAVTGSIMYGSGAVVNMMAASQNRGAGGFSGQAFASFANALVWLVYAFVQNDYNMKISNGAGILFFLLQGVQLLFFRYNKPREEAETQEVHRRLLGEDAEEP